MSKLWSLSTALRQVGLIAGLLGSCLCQGQVARKPSSYVPDDDVIVKPEENKISFYKQYVASDKSEDVVKLRNQIKVWNDNQIFADQYGLNTSLTGSAYFVPTADEKWLYFKDKYLRYLRRQGEQPFKDMPKTWYQEYRASNEIDTIDQMENRFRNTTRTTTRGEALPKSLQAHEVSIWKKTKFIFQPRVDQGLAIVGFSAPLLDARAWVGINGQTEFNVQHRQDDIGLRIMWNYFAQTGKYFSSLDQRLTPTMYARITSSRDPASVVVDNSFMLFYAKPF